MNISAIRSNFHSKNLGFYSEITPECFKLTQSLSSEIRSLLDQPRHTLLVSCSFQGCNARKVISEVYTSFVLQCTVSGGNVNTRRMSKPDMGSIFHIKKSMKYSGHRKLLCELSKLSRLKAFNLLGY